MADEREKLREALDQVQGQLDEVRRRDPQFAKNLEAMMGAARTALDGPPLRGEEHGSLMRRLGDSVHKYERSHPKLAAALGGIVDALAEIGI